MISNYSQSGSTCYLIVKNVSYWRQNEKLWEASSLRNKQMCVSKHVPKSSQAFTFFFSCSDNTIIEFSSTQKKKVTLGL
jgi:hypothetical protein